MMALHACWILHARASAESALIRSERMLRHAHAMDCMQGRNAAFHAAAARNYAAFLATSPPLLLVTLWTQRTMDGNSLVHEVIQAFPSKATLLLVSTLDVIARLPDAVHRMLDFENDAGLTPLALAVQASSHVLSATSDIGMMPASAAKHVLICKHASKPVVMHTSSMLQCTNCMRRAETSGRTREAAKT